jgi:hypothetical protein
MFGAGLGSVIRPNHYNACLAAGRAGYLVDFDLSQVPRADAAPGARAFALLALVRRSRPRLRAQARSRPAEH